MNGSEDLRRLYLELLKKSVLATLYEEAAWHILGSRPDVRSGPLKRWIRKTVLNLIHSRGYVLAKPIPMTPKLLTAIENGAESGFFAHSMIGIHRLNNAQECIETVVAENIAGDIIETGAWRGGSAIVMRGVLKSLNATDRTIWVADSFKGFPASDNPADNEVDLASFSEGGPLDLWLSVPRKRVEATFERYGLLDDQVRFLEGWFEDTLPAAPIESLSVLRLDGDLYKSTMDVLETLYHKVSPGGFVIVDDYGTWPQCRAAVEEFRSREKIEEPMQTIDADGANSVFWRVSK